MHLSRVFSLSPYFIWRYLDCLALRYSISQRLFSSLTYYLFLINFSLPHSFFFRIALHMTTLSHCLFHRHSISQTFTRIIASVTLLTSCSLQTFPAHQDIDFIHFTFSAKELNNFQITIKLHHLLFTLSQRWSKVVHSALGRFYIFFAYQRLL